MRAWKKWKKGCMQQRWHWKVILQNLSLVGAGEQKEIISKAKTTKQAI